MSKKPLALALLLIAGLAARPAAALRPFDGTDADVAPAGTFELEWGPLGLLREGHRRSLIGTATVANFGLGGDNEFVAEGRVVHRSVSDVGPRTSLEDAAVSLKHMLRKGSLQEGGSSVSIAMECSLLLPGATGQNHTGAGCAAIGSQRFGLVALHLNAALARTRERNSQRFTSLIVDGGTEADVWHSVAEAFFLREGGQGTTRSLLLGLIAKRDESMRFDAGVRRARSGHETVTELRAGLTWTVPP